MDEDAGTLHCIASRAIRALGNAASGNENNKTLIQKLTKERLFKARFLYVFYYVGHIFLDFEIISKNLPQ